MAKKSKGVNVNPTGLPDKNPRPSGYPMKKGPDKPLISPRVEPLSMNPFYKQVSVNVPPATLAGPNSTVGTHGGKSGKKK